MYAAYSVRVCVKNMFVLSAKVVCFEVNYFITKRLLSIQLCLL